MVILSSKRNKLFKCLEGYVNKSKKYLSGDCKWILIKLSCLNNYKVLCNLETLHSFAVSNSYKVIAMFCRPQFDGNTKI